jgi:transcriptional regulator GlxA family with amidase domain
MYRSHSGERDMRISVVAFEDFTDLDVFLMWDLLNRVDAPDWTVRMIGDRPFHRSRTGVTVHMQGSIDEANHSDVVLFASGPGTRAKLKDPSYLRTFRLNPAEQHIGSICSGALILAALGLLDGKRVTTHPSVKEALSKFPVEVVDEPFVCEGKIATAGGCLAAVYLTRWIVETFAGSSSWQKVLAEVQPVGRVWVLPSNSQSQSRHDDRPDERRSAPDLLARPQ